MIAWRLMTFDPTISLGTILSFIGLILVLIGLHSANIKRISEMEVKLDLVYEWFKEKLREDSAELRRKRDNGDSDSRSS